MPVLVRRRLRAQRRASGVEGTRFDMAETARGVVADAGVTEKATLLAGRPVVTELRAVKTARGGAGAVAAHALVVGGS